MEPVHFNPADETSQLPTTPDIPETQQLASNLSVPVHSESNSCFILGTHHDSDSDSDSSPVPGPLRAFTANKMTTPVDGLELENLTKTFLSGMGPAGEDTAVVAVHKNSSSGLTRRARFESFRFFTEAVARKCGGNPNIKNAWFGGSKAEIADILAHGFSSRNEEVAGRIHLVPASFALDAAVRCGVDDDGMRHVLMCRVILGKSELMPEGYSRNRSDSDEFDSGVDSMLAPRKYIVWSASMNSHICPSYVVSFKAPGDLEKYAAPPRSVISYIDLLPVLARLLPASKMQVLCKWRDDCKEKKISSAELHRRLIREVDGKVLADAVKLVPTMVHLPSLMKVLPRFLPASKMAVFAKLRDDYLANKISRAELNRSLTFVVDKKVMASAITLMKPTQGGPGVAALARFLPPSQMKILSGLIMYFEAKKITRAEFNRKFKLIVDGKMMASATRLVTPSTQQKSNTASNVEDQLKDPSSSISFPHLMPLLERSLSPQKMALLRKSLDDLRERKISRAQLIQRARLIVGKELMVSAVKSYRSGLQNV